MHYTAAPPSLPGMPPAVATWHAPRVVRAAGITYRQLDHWIRSGLIEPSVPAAGSGSQRRFTFDDAVRFAIARTILGSNHGRGSVSVLDADPALRAYERLGTHHCRLICHDGVWAATTGRSAPDLLAGCVIVTVVDVERLAAEVAEILEVELP